MIQPVVGSLGLDLYEDLQPVMYEDSESNGWAGLLFISTITNMIQDIDDLVREVPKDWVVPVDVDPGPRNLIPNGDIEDGITSNWKDSFTGGHPGSLILADPIVSIGSKSLRWLGTTPSGTSFPGFLTDVHGVPGHKYRGTATLKANTYPSGANNQFLFHLRFYNLDISSFVDSTVVLVTGTNIEFVVVEDVAPVNTAWVRMLAYTISTASSPADLVLDDASIVDLSLGNPPGWAKVLDPDIVPNEGINWLGQLVGVRITPRLPTTPEPDYYYNIRTQVKDKAGHSRGTKDSLINSVQSTLTGSKTVYVNERTTPYAFTVSVLDSECLDANISTAAAISQKPAGLVLTFVVIAGGFDLLFASNTNFTDMTATHANFDAARDNPGA